MRSSVVRRIVVCSPCAVAASSAHHRRRNIPACVASGERRRTPQAALGNFAPLPRCTWRPAARPTVRWRAVMTRHRARPGAHRRGGPPRATYRPDPARCTRAPPRATPPRARPSSHSFSRTRAHVTDLGAYLQASTCRWSASPSRTRIRHTWSAAAARRAFGSKNSLARGSISTRMLLRRPSSTASPPPTPPPLTPVCICRV